MTSVTVTFAAGTSAGLSLVEITSNDGSTVYGSKATPTDTSAISLSSTIAATTSETQYKVRVTPKIHTAMPASPGASYAVTGRVTAIASAYPKVYDDTSSATVTIDNLSPANPTWGTITKLDGRIDLGWTNPGVDFQKSLVSRSVAEPGVGAPAEGSDPVLSDPVGNGTAVYSGAGVSHQDTGLNNGSLYWYRAYARDACGNWSHQGAGTGPHVPAAPGTTVADADITVEASSCKQLTITAPFKGDADNDGQTVVTVDAATKCTLTGASPRRCTVGVNPTGSDQPITYSVNVSFSDPDGVTGDASVNRSPQAPGCTAANTSAPIVEILRPGNLHAVGDPVTARVKISDADGFGGSPVTWRTYVQGGSPGSFVATGLTRKTTEEANFGCPGALNCQIWDISISIPSPGYYNLEVKATDSNSSTGLAALTLWRSDVPGMGTLLVQSGGQQLCINCHELQTHACDQNCDEQSYWAIPCDTCHTPHGTRNLSGIREQIETPNSGSREVAFGRRVGAVADYATDPDCSALTGEAKKACSSYANEGAGNVLGPCQVCHTLTSEPGGAPRWRNSGDSGLHYPAASTTQCTACHTHAAGFSGAGAACNTCHNAPPAIGKHGTHDEVWDSTEGNLPTSYEEATSHASTTQYGFPCAKCHSGGHINDSAHDGTTTSPWQVEVDGAFDTTTDPTNPGGTYSGTYNQSQEQGPIGQYWSYSDGTCGNLYCHSRANPLGGTNQFATVTWETGSIADCISCHDTRGDVATPTNLSPAHQVHTATDLYDLACTRCHDLTVDVDTAIADKREHVDGQKDVIFDATAPSNAGISYAGSPTYTCSGTYCHSDGTDNDPSGGYTSPNVDLSWNGGTADCRSCHSGDATTAPTMASNAHGAHVDNAATIAINYRCAECHSSTVSAADNESITGLTNHVDGTKTIVGAKVDSPYVSPTCASSYCHSSGQAPAGTSFEYYSMDWTSSTIADCAGCHGRHSDNAFVSAAAEPNYTNDGPGAANANSHQRHVASAADCTKCHNRTTSDGLAIIEDPNTAGTSLHTNQSRDVAISASYDTNGATSNYTVGSKTCNDVACHGSGTPQWGATLVCLDCHDGPDGGTLGDGTPNGVGDEWTTAATGSVGHGGVTGSGGASGPLNSALGGCDYCHQLERRSHAHGGHESLSSPLHGHRQHAVSPVPFGG